MTLTFDCNKSLPMSLLMTAGALGGFAMSVLSTQLAQTAGWKSGWLLYTVFAAIASMVAFHRGRLIGQILLAGRENGNHLGTTHSAIRPGTNELYICTNDAKNGAWIFKASAFAKASMAGFQFQ